MAEAEQGQARLRFVCRYPELRVTDTPIAVPLRMGRFGLSEVINHLLELSPPLPFDFIVAGQLLRSSLRKFVASQGISLESILEVEYFPAAHLREDNALRRDVPAWVGCLERLPGGALLAGAYDGQLRALRVRDLQDAVAADGSPSCIAASRLPLRCAAVLPLAGAEGAEGAAHLVVTAGKEQSVFGVRAETPAGHADDADEAPGPRLSSVLLGTGHGNSVESMAVGRDAAGAPVLFSGDWSGLVCAWRGLPEAAEAARQAAAGAARRGAGAGKRQRVRGEEAGAAAEGGAGAEPVVQSVEHAAIFKAHVQSVSGLAVSEDGGFLMSCSWDRSVKLWDVARQDCINTLSGSYVCTSISLNSAPGSSGGLVVTSHPDGAARMWDLRARTESVIAAHFNAGTKQWVSSARWQPGSPHMFASADFDGVLRLWDARSPAEPISAVRNAHEGKVLCLLWSEGRLFSGGADCVVRAHDVSGSQFVAEAPPAAEEQA